MNSVDFQVTRRPGGRIEVAILQDNKVVFVNTVTPGSEKSRSKFLEQLIEKCPGLKDEIPGIETKLMQLACEAPEDSGEPESASTKQADLLIALAKDWRFVHDAQGQAFAIIEVNGHREVWPVDSEGFRGHLNLAFFREHQRAASPQSMTTAIATLKARAMFDGTEVEVHLRVAGSAGATWIDLCAANPVNMRVAQQFC
jgi:hypothetical protein